MAKSGYIVEFPNDEAAHKKQMLLLKLLKMKSVEFAYSVDSDLVAHDEAPLLNLHCLPSAVLQIRRGKRDNLGKNCHITLLKHVF